MEFMNTLGYPKKKIFEAEQFFNHIQDFDEITYEDRPIVERKQLNEDEEEN